MKQLLTFYEERKALPLCETGHRSLTQVDSRISKRQLAKLWLLHNLSVLKTRATVSSLGFQN